MSCAVGIDLGTTNSCVAIYRNGKVEIVSDNCGNRIIPSMIAFDGNRRLVGHDARNQQFKNLRNTVYDVKRIIGRSYNDPAIQERLKHWPFKVDLVPPNCPVVSITKGGGQAVAYCPEELSAALLIALKERAQNYLQRPVTEAVITVPAYFNEVQRQATKDAATIAQLKVLRIINEPTAAAIAYGINKIDKEVQNILVVDLGGGTFDVTVLTMEDGIFDVIATHGDTDLGGQDFTNVIMAKLTSELLSKWSASAFIGNEAVLERLRNECEKAKKMLSALHEYTIELPNLLNSGNDFVRNVTREEFDRWAAALYERIMKVVDDVLAQATLNKADVNNILLIGGSTRLHRLQTLLEDYFDGRKPCRSINPDEAVAIGAAIHAALLSGANMSVYTLCDVTPLSLGIEIFNGLMSVVVPRNTKIPNRINRQYETHHDNATTMTFKIYEGEREIAQRNIYIGEFRLLGITKARKGKVKVQVSFDVSSDGLMTISAVEKNSKGVEKQIQIAGSSSRLKQEQIDKMISEARNFYMEDMKEAEILRLKGELESYCYEVRSKCQQQHEAIRSKLEQSCQLSLDWLEQNTITTTDALERQLRQLKLTCGSYLVKTNQR